MTDLNLWQFILSQVKKGTPVALLCVMESHGSSPGRRGFKMAVAHKKIVGSIGGGMMEYKFVELAKEMLVSDREPFSLKKQIHSKSAKINQSGMICSGEQTIYLSLIKNSDIDSIEAMIASLNMNQHGTLHIDPSGISFGIIPPKDDYYFEMTNDEIWKYSERIGFKNKLHIIGGGHCSLALSELMSKMDFNISVFDDRPGLNTMVDNGFVQTKFVLNNYNDLSKLINSGNDVYVVIMTLGYRSDNIALQTLIDKDFKYLGVLGSKSKMKELFADWKKAGIPEKKLQKIHSPIGIDIRSQTPMEIAVSIAAEIIREKNITLP